MESRRLSDFEAVLRANKPPAAPANLEQNVLRRVRLMGAREPGWPALVADLLVRTQVALPLLAVSVILGAVLSAGVISTTAEAQPMVRKALDFQSLMDLKQSEILPAR